MSDRKQKLLYYTLSLGPIFISTYLFVFTDITPVNSGIIIFDWVVRALILSILVIGYIGAFIAFTNWYEKRYKKLSPTSLVLIFQFTPILLVVFFGIYIYFTK